MRNLLLLVFTLLFAQGIFAENILFNTTGKLGPVGFAVEKYLRCDTNSDLKFIPLSFNDGALVLDNRYAEPYSIFSKEFKLESSTKYTLSGFFRSSVPGEKVWFSLFKIDPEWSAFGSEGFALSDTWTPFTFSFTTKKGSGKNGEGWYYLRICPPKKSLFHGTIEASAATLGFRNLRLTKEGDSTPDRVEAVIVPAKEIVELPSDGTRAKMTLKVANPAKNDYQGTIYVTGRDEYTGKLLFQRDFPVKLAPGETKDFLFSEKITRFGGVRISAKAKSLHALDGFFIVIGKYTPRPIDVTRDFAVGFNGGLVYDLPPSTKVPTYRVSNSQLEDPIRILSRIGCRILRDHSVGVRGVDWPAVEWKEGEFKFTRLDRQLALYKKYNITLFPVIGSNFVLRKGSRALPDWVIPTAEQVKNDPPNCLLQFHGLVFLPPVGLYKNYIRKTVEHIKGQVPVYEIMNEPNLYLGPKTYVRYLKAAYEAIKEADPAAKVCSFCLTTDFGAGGTDWFLDCVKAGGMPYADAVGFHPYSSSQMGSLHPADKNIAGLKKTMAACGRPGIPLWNTELYYLRDDLRDSWGIQPHHVVQRFLVDLGEGVTQSVSAELGSLWKKMLTPHIMSFAESNEMIPSENMAAYNTMARLFEGAKPVKKIRFLNDVICYVYRKDGKLIAAVWNYSGKKGIHGDFSAFQVMDLFGNPEKSAEKPLGAAPFYLTAGKLSDAEFLAKLDSLPIRLEQPVYGSSIARRVGNTLFLTLFNDSSERQSGTAGITGHGITAQQPTSFTIPAQSRMTLEIPVKDAKNDGKPATLMLLLNGTVFRLPVEIVRNTLWGKTFKMKNAEGTIQFGGGEITVSMSVRDSTNSGPTGKRSWWDVDCVELFFDTDPLNLPVNHGWGYTPQTFRLFITPRDVEKLHAQGGIKADACKLNLKQTAGGYTFELTVPAKTGKWLGFDVKINDRSSTGKQEIQLGNGKELWRNRCNFSMVK